MKCYASMTEICTLGILCVVCLVIGIGVMWYLHPCRPHPEDDYEWNADK